jgi:hypothetical protein
MLRRPASLPLAVAAVGVLAVVLSGCGDPPRPGEPWPPPTTAGAASPAPSPSRICVAAVSGRPDAYRTAPCDDPAALAYQLARVTAPAKCSDEHDFIIDLAVDPPVKASLTSTSNNLACMRRLKPPHARDPGGGGGTIGVGDCVYSAPGPSYGPIATESIFEVPCAEPGGHTIYRVFQMDEYAYRCPSGRTALKFTIAPFLPNSAAKTWYVCAEAV